VRDRASVFGKDLFGFAPLGLLGFAVVAVRGQRRDAFLALSVVAFTVAYGLFYYGNTPLFGSRHLFAVAPLFWLLVARALVEPLHPRVGSSLVVAVLITGAVTGIPRWMWSVYTLRMDASKRVDIPTVVDRAEISRGLLVTGGELSFISGFDPIRDGRDRIIVRFDGSGLKDLRRMYPELPVHAVLEGDTVQTQQLAPPPPGLLFELERAWPSFLQPAGIATRVVTTKTCCNVDSSGERVLYVFQAHTGASLTIPFTVPRAGRFALRVDGLVAPDYGNYAIRVDDHALPAWTGYSPTLAHRQGTPTAPLELTAGPHLIKFTCTGKEPDSRGLLAAFDALIGIP